MTELYDVLKERKGIPSGDFIAAMWGKGEKPEVIDTYDGGLPALLEDSAEGVLRSYRIYGNNMLGGIGEPTSSPEPQGYKIPMKYAVPVPTEYESGSIGSDGEDEEPGSQDGYILRTHGMIPLTETSYQIFAMQDRYANSRINLVAYFYDDEGTYIGRYPESGSESSPLSITVSDPDIAYMRLTAALIYSPLIYPLTPEDITASFLMPPAVTVPLYIGTSRLKSDEYTDYAEQKIYRLVDDVLTPSDPPVPLSQLPTLQGATVYYADGRFLPVRAVMEYRRE